MSLDGIKSLDVIETMENYLNSIRPSEEIRKKLDFGYEIQNQSIILFEIRPHWQDASIIQHHQFAKCTFVHEKNIWKIFWMRASGKWDAYKPCPTVNKLSDFLKIVEEDNHGCFKG